MAALNNNRLRFIAEYVSVMPRNAGAAYQRVYGCDDNSARANASRLMSDESVLAEIARREKEAAADLALTAEDVLRELFLVASADPRELSEHYVGSCRYCHGDGHEYQRTPAEYKRDFAAYAASVPGLADPLGIHFALLGGLGFNPKRLPNPACPECFGHGAGYEIMKDTRTLSPAAARLYQGVERTKHGLKFITRSPDKCIDLAGQYLGLFRSRVEHSGPGGKPIPVAATTVSLKAIDANTAAQMYQALITAA